MSGIKRVIVTGGSGRLGRFVVADLLDSGYEVRNIDVVTSDATEYLDIDILDYEAVFAAFDGYDAVVHLAANPEPDFDHVTGAARFEHNMVSTFNVFQAAVASGMQRVVWASSETVYGFPFESNAPEALPIVEGSRLQPQNAYALAKAACEEVADYLSETSGIPFIGLRFSNVHVEEPGTNASYELIPEYQGDPRSRYFNLWGYIDARDGASACRRALEADVEGAHALPVFAADTIMDLPNDELVAAVFPGTPLAADTPPHATLVSIAHTNAVLGWEPIYSWRTVAGG